MAVTLWSIIMPFCFGYDGDILCFWRTTHSTVIFGIYRALYTTRLQARIGTLNNTICKSFLRAQLKQSSKEKQQANPLADKGQRTLFGLTKIDVSHVNSRLVGISWSGRRCSRGRSRRGRGGRCRNRSRCVGARSRGGRCGCGGGGRSRLSRGFGLVEDELDCGVAVPLHIEDVNVKALAAVAEQVVFVAVGHHAAGHVATAGNVLTGEDLFFLRDAVSKLRHQSLSLGEGGRLARAADGIGRDLRALRVSHDGDL
ncbi:uncharacterized protein PgNI_00603 [Pyricularia grisea]|uniref:Uncharacterized protein n=1 Tax=Pyricularia grisea TaxID=148305 RepID=A0A6P8BFS8_PYRGI|nr:uncharacterized protein PgNI_00603 [Pyricularia grisea]TLD15570.1 hypothetical protein PgNI_00603 [Pyricularia grisea]